MNVVFNEIHSRIVMTGKNSEMVYYPRQGTWEVSPFNWYGIFNIEFGKLAIL